ncbi:unnamed protein product [Mesocestoides corti]|uniref:RPAP1_C domain-containing protein n=1 Tax=Mesocestoides corti TaxID=53468 RepID=A0A0R3UFD3_MESCO|nr:unnamed protein product [Mesocestoides corti]
MQIIPKAAMSHLGESWISNTSSLGFVVSDYSVLGLTIGLLLIDLSPVSLALLSASAARKCRTTQALALVWRFDAADPFLHRSWLRCLDHVVTCRNPPSRQA